MPACALAEFVPERKYEEIADPPTPVRGHAVVGVAMVPSAGALQSDTLWVRPGPVGMLPGVRVDVTSANGRLRGEGTWKFVQQAEKQPTWHALSVPPKATRPDKPEHLALSVRPLSDAAGAMPVFFVSAIGKAAPPDASKLRLYVNSRRGEVFVFLKDGKTHVRCTPIEGMQVVRFDATCDVDLPIGSEAGSTQLTVVRRDGHQSSNQQIEVRW